MAINKAQLEALKKKHPWRWGDKATVLVRILPSNANLETPMVFAFRNGVVIRKGKWHRITQDTFPLAADKVTDGGQPVCEFREDPLAKTVRQISEEADARRAERREKREKDGLSPKQIRNQEKFERLEAKLDGAAAQLKDAKEALDEKTASLEEEKAALEAAREALEEEKAAFRQQQEKAGLIEVEKSDPDGDPSEVDTSPTEEPDPEDDPGEKALESDPEPEETQPKTTKKVSVKSLRRRGGKTKE